MIIAVFRTREHTLKFASELNRRGYSASVVNTPREVHSGCGVSVRFDERASGVARKLIGYFDFDSFAGFYVSETKGYRFIQ
ncbi:MAG: DUF3343 domain-containing protein [Clostridiales bacterium]|jgi:hypothetical protein|nr:DUF3343 domain-containing protein [Clostridiales bacterium]